MDKKEHLQAVIRGELMKRRRPGRALTLTQGIILAIIVIISTPFTVAATNHFTKPDTARMEYQVHKMISAYIAEELEKQRSL